MAPITWRTIAAPQLDSSFVGDAANLINRGLTQGSGLIKDAYNTEQGNILQKVRQDAYTDPNMSKAGLANLVGLSGLDAQNQQAAMNYGSGLLEDRARKAKQLEQQQYDRGRQAEIDKQTKARNLLSNELTTQKINTGNRAEDDALQKKADDQRLKSIESTLLGNSNLSDDDLFALGTQIKSDPQNAHMAPQIDKLVADRIAQNSQLDSSMKQFRDQSISAVTNQIENEKTAANAEIAQQQAYVDQSPFTASEKMLENQSLGQYINKNLGGDSSWFFNDFAGSGDNLIKTMRDKAVDPSLVTKVRNSIKEAWVKSNPNVTKKQLAAFDKDYTRIPDAAIVAALTATTQAVQDDKNKIANIDDTFDSILEQNAADYFAFKTRSGQVASKVNSLKNHLRTLDKNLADSKLAINKNVIQQQKAKNNLYSFR